MRVGDLVYDHALGLAGIVVSVNPVLMCACEWMDILYEDGEIIEAPVDDGAMEVISESR